MFDLGSSRLKPYTVSILREVATYLKTVPKRISLTGHTDTTPYAGISGYTNWDLSTDRANAARRALEGAGYDTNQISRVAGLASSVLFDKQNPRSPVNRRISIVVMTQQAEEDAQRIDIPSAPVGGAEASVSDDSPATEVPAAMESPVPEAQAG
jgi:chemotaxis protein MotB